MKRCVIAIILFMLLGAATSVGVAWWCALQEHDWDEPEGPYYCNDWVVETWRHTGVWYVMGAGGLHLTVADDPEETMEADEVLSWSALLRTRPKRELHTFHEAFAGWPMPCVRQAVIAKGPERTVGGSLSERPDDVGYSSGYSDELVFPNPFMGWRTEGAVVGRNPIDAFGLSDLRMLPIQPVWTGLLVNSLLFALTWLIALRSVTVPLWLWAVLRRRRRRRKGRCPECGQDLRSTPSATCPECGAKGKHRRPLLSSSWLLGVSIVAILVCGIGAAYVGSFASDPPYAPIHRAVWEGELEAIESEIDSGADLDQRSHRTTGWTGTALALACGLGEDEPVRVLLDAGADLTATDEHGVTPLFQACLRDDNGAVIRRLMEAGANVNVQVQDLTPLCMAAMTQDESIVVAMIDAGAEVNPSIDRLGNAPLCMATREADIGRVRRLLEAGATTNAYAMQFAARHSTADMMKLLVSYGGDVHAVGAAGENAYFGATLNDDPHDVVTYLCEQGVDVNVQNDEGEAPLHAAVLCGNMPLMQLLLDCGADVTLTDLYGQTILHIDAALVEQVVSRGADVDARDNRGCTPLFAAAESGSVAGVQALLEHGADVDARDNDGETPLHEVAFADDDHTVEIGRLLIDRGADVNALSEYGMSPLNKAALIGPPTLVELLLEYGADPNNAGADDSTPLCNALNNDKLAAIARLLVDHGADIDALDGDGQSALLIASWFGVEEAQILLDLGANPLLENENGLTVREFVELHWNDNGRCDDVIQLLREAEKRWRERD